MVDQNSISDLEDVFTEYSKTSTVHGVRYLCDKRRHWSERIWWIISVSTSIIMCSIFLFGAFSKWNVSPLIMYACDLCQKFKTLSKKELIFKMKFYILNNKQNLCR